MNKARIVLLSTLAAAAAVPMAPAIAGGCNGVVDIFKWGCAPWDNNNGAKFPYFKKTTVAKKVPAGTPYQNKDGNLMVKVDGQWMPVANSAGVVAAGGLNQPNGVIAAGGLNLQVVQGN